MGRLNPLQTSWGRATMTPITPATRGSVNVRHDGGGLQLQLVTMATGYRWQLHVVTTPSRNITGMGNRIYK